MIDCKTMGLWQGWTNLSHYPSHCIQEIFPGGCLTDDGSKPLALVLSSTSDWNGAFSTKQHQHDLLEALAKTHTVCHRYIQDSSEFNQHLIGQLSHQKKIDVLVMRAHGTSLSQQYAKELISPYSPRKFFAALRSSLTPDATIILQSCSNAATCGEDDFASFIRSMAPPQATVYAATQPFDRTEVRSGTPPKVRLFRKEMDVTYRSGADGFCNNPLDHNWIQKLKNRLDLLGQLVDQGRAYEAAISLATEAFKSTSILIQHSAIDLFKKLFDQDQGYEAAISVVTEAFKSSDGWTRYKTFDLFEKLFDKGKGFGAAFSVATEAVKSTDDSIRKRAIELFSTLYNFITSSLTLVLRVAS